MTHALSRSPFAKVLSIHADPRDGVSPAKLQLRGSSEDEFHGNPMDFYKNWEEYTIKIITAWWFGILFFYFSIIYGKNNPN
jgi:hypothetical protein